MKFAAYLIAGVVIGLTVAWWQGIGASGGGVEPGLNAGDRAAIERRISVLEMELERERLERQALADQIEDFRSVAPVPVVGGDNEVTARVVERERVRFPDGLPESAVQVERSLEQRQVDRFVAAGFAPDRAQWLLQREEELEMEALRARYDARQAGARDEEIADMTVSRLMREELGDADYERYLAGQGRPTSVSVREVLTNSPAREAGLLPGDEILVYDGNRIFEMNELSTLTQASKPGSTVVLEVERDGQRLQFYVDGGPLGISGGGRSRRDFDGGR